MALNCEPLGAAAWRVWGQAAGSPCRLGNRLGPRGTRLRRTEPSVPEPRTRSHTAYRALNTREHREYLNITRDVVEAATLILSGPAQAC